MNKLRALRRQLQRALLAKAGQVADECGGGWRDVLAFAWISYCYERGPGHPRTYLGHIRNEARALRAYSYDR